MVSVKQNILDSLIGNKKALNRLAYEFNKHYRTIERWVERADEILTTPKAVKAISEELEIPESEILSGVETA